MYKTDIILEDKLQYEVYMLLEISTQKLIRSRQQKEKSQQKLEKFQDLTKKIQQKNNQELHIHPTHAPHNCTNIDLRL
jgi:hypothetical protein